MKVEGQGHKVAQLVSSKSVVSRWRRRHDTQIFSLLARNEWPLVTVVYHRRSN